jgi:hypothetical protein
MSHCLYDWQKLKAWGGRFVTDADRPVVVSEVLAEGPGAVAWFACYLLDQYGEAVACAFCAVVSDRHRGREELAAGGFPSEAWRAPGCDDRICRG